MVKIKNLNSLLISVLGLKIKMNLFHLVIFSLFFVFNLYISHQHGYWTVQLLHQIQIPSHLCTNLLPTYHPFVIGDQLIHQVRHHFLNTIWTLIFVNFLQNEFQWSTLCFTLNSTNQSMYKALHYFKILKDIALGIVSDLENRILFVKWTLSILSK